MSVFEADRRTAASLRPGPAGDRLRYEQQRLAKLRGYGVLDTAPEAVFDELVLVAAQVAGVPTALVGLIDDEREWFKAKVGLDLDCASREVAMCDHVVATRREMVVADTHLDERFAGHVMVVGDPHVRFYAGFPLTTPDGFVLGTLCVVDYQPRELSTAQVAAMRALAGQVMCQLELRASLARERAVTSSQQEVMAALVKAESRWHDLVEFTSDVIISRHDLDGTVRYVSPAVATVLGLDPLAEGGVDASMHVHPDDTAAVGAAMAEVVAGRPASLTVRSRHADGGWRHLEMRLTPGTDGDGRVVEMFSAARDVTDRVVQAEELAAERALAAVAQRYLNTVLEAVDVGVVACDVDGRLTLFNRAAQELHGMDADPSVDSGDWASRYSIYEADGTTPMGADRVPLRRALDGKAVHDELIVVAPEVCEPRLLRCHGEQLRDSTGRVLGAVVAMTDVTAVVRAEAEAEGARRRAEAHAEALEGAHAELRTALDAIPRSITLASVVRDAAGVPVDLCVRWVNHRTVAAAGKPLAGLVGLRLAEAFPTIAAEFGGRYLDVARTGVPLELSSASFDGLRQGGSYDITVVPWSDDGLLVDVGDVTDLAVARHRAEEANSFFDAVLAATPDYTFTVECATGKLIYGPDDRDVLGFTTAELQALGSDRARALTHPDDLDLLRRAMDDAAGLPDGEIAQIRVRGLHKDGSWRWLHRRLTPFRRDAAGAVMEVLGVVRDVTDLVDAESRLHHAARHDQLTDLPNRTLLLERMQELVDRAGASGEEVAVLFCDLDGFKRVNDTLGHAAGDDVLREIAGRLRSVVRDGDTVARVGGDEFVVLVRAWRRPAEGSRKRGFAPSVLAERITETVRRPVSAGGALHQLSASVGIAVLRPGSGDPRSVEDVLHLADTAMYRAKTSGKDRVVTLEA